MTAESRIPEDVLEYMQEVGMDTSCRACVADAMVVVARLAQGLEQSANGQTAPRGSFAKYAEEEEEDDFHDQ